MRPLPAEFLLGGLTQCRIYLLIAPLTQDGLRLLTHVRPPVSNRLWEYGQIPRDRGFGQLPNRWKKAI